MGVYPMEIIFLILGTISIIKAFRLRNKRIKLLRYGIKVEGEVVKIRKEKSKRDSTPNNIVYVLKPVIEFNVDGKLVTKASKIYSDPCPYHIGDKVNVTYNPDDANEFTLNDGRQYRWRFFCLAGEY